MAATQKFSNSALVVYTKLSPNHSGQRTHNIDTLAIHCLPVDKTELLTPNGWIKLRDVNKGDIVAASDKDLNISFEPVQEVVPIRREDVYAFSTGFMGTLKHRMLFKSQYELESGKPFREGTVEDILRYNSAIYIPNSGKIKGNGIDLEQNMINFICAVQADGSYQYNDAHSKIYYIRMRFWKQEKINRFRRILKVLNFKYKENTIYGTKNYENGIEFIIKDRAAIDLCEQYLDNKMFSYKLMDMTIPQAEIFARCLTLWDGLCIESENYTEMRYISHKKQNIDVVSAVLTTHGIGIHQDGDHTLTFKLKEYRTIGTKPGVIKDMEISCVSVPSGFILIRQNGRVHIVGNCMAGNCSVETCGNIFADKNRQASSNYGIGSDGRIALYVEEKNRSWCTSSAAVDQRAITIEVANNTGAPSWGISDKAMESLINLIVDIIQRNPDISELKWEGNKSLMGKVDRQNMVVHRWTAAKACPGDYLFTKHKYIVEQVNSRLKTQGSTVPEIPTASKPNIISGTPEKMLWKFLDSKGLSDIAKAALMGNLFAESGFVSNNLQNSYEKKLGYTDEEYTKAVDNGTYKNFIHDKAGYGLAQWTYWSRKQELFVYARDHGGKSIGDFVMQEEFLWYELNKSFKSMLNKLSKTSTLKEATDIVLIEFENPADKSEAVKNKRLAYAEEFYKKNADGDGTTHFPYTVKVNDGALNIRKGPGTNYSKVGCIKDNGVYTIVEESTGPGAKKWGRLKSGAGWISLDYCIKIS